MLTVPSRSPLRSKFPTPDEIPAPEKMVEGELGESGISGTSSSNDEPGTLEKATTDYEKHRQSRIADDKARMEALGLRYLANSLMGSSKNGGERKGKPQSKRAAVKQEDDDEYSPNDEEEEEEEDSDGGFSSSDVEFKEENVSGRISRARARSTKAKSRKSRSKKNAPIQKSMDFKDFMDEDEALKQGIALSLKDSGDFSDMQHCGPSQGSNAQAAGVNDKEENTRRRKRKSLSSRVQMTADDLIIHFCQLDEAGKGSIRLRDLQRMAAVHDFTWTDKELADMVQCFDSDKDNKLTLDDFQNMVMRCNMLQGLENP